MPKFFGLFSNKGLTTFFGSTFFATRGAGATFFFPFFGLFGCNITIMHNSNIHFWCTKTYTLRVTIKMENISRLIVSLLRYDPIGEFNVDWKAEYSALSSTRSQKKKLKQPTPVPQNQRQKRCNCTRFDNVSTENTFPIHY